MVTKRNDNYNIFRKSIDDKFWKPKENKDNFISNMAYPVISENRESIINNLKNNGVECRPLLSGSLSRQPYWYENFGKISLKNADFIHDNGLYVPNNHEISTDEIEKICKAINEAN